jgi:chromosome segregation and condensation protein ScpB
MIDQAALFDARTDLKPWQQRQVPLADPASTSRGLVHEHSTDTERQAAALVAPRTGTGRLRVLTIIAESGPLTDYDISVLLGMRLYTAAPRRGELLRGGWIEDSGERHPTDSGTLATAWRLSERGRAEWLRREAVSG